MEEKQKVFKNPVNYVTPDVLELLKEADNLQFNNPYNKKPKERYVYSGVYILYDMGNIVYIGCSNDIYNRLECHFKENTKQYDEYEILCYNENDMKIIERYLINKFMPKYNKDSITKKIKNEIQHNN